MSKVTGVKEKLHMPMYDAFTWCRRTPYSAHRRSRAK